VGFNSNSTYNSKSMQVSNPIRFYILKILHLQSPVSTKPSPTSNLTTNAIELKTSPLQFQTLD
jgi:hypothetical protein